jgi:hypothetical protein
VAWLLNIRGSDVDRTPVALSFVIAHADGTADCSSRPKNSRPRWPRIWAMPCACNRATVLPRPSPP